MSLHMQTQVFNHKKQAALQALNNNRLQQALELYTEALQIAETLPHLCPEIPKILSNRSLVYYKLALDDANLSTNLDPFEIKGYWRAAQAHKKLGQVDCALDCFIRGYNVSVSQDQEEEILRFLVEIVFIIITLRYDPINLLKNSKIHPSSIQTQRNLLQRLASNNCWEGVSLLVMGVHAGPPSTLDASASSCPIDNLSVGNLLKNTSITQLKRFGVDLAVCLLKSGASCEDIEQKMEEPVIHVGLKVALDTGKISLIKLMFSQYLKTPETKDALNREGRTAFHVLVHSGRINDSIGETLLRLLINKGCQSSIPDRNGKLAIDYLTPDDLGFNILSTTTKVADSIVKEKIIEMKEKGNTAFKNREYEEALIFYNRAIFMVNGYENLTREAAIVLTNRSLVHSTLHNVTEALEDAEKAVRCDPTWMKGYWRRGVILQQKKLFQKSFSVFLEGYYSGNGTHSEKCNILVEAVASFSNITEKQELEASYKGLCKVSSEVWPEVLSRLSVRGEWAAIRYLVLGIDFQYINGQVIPSGIAKDADLKGITYETLFQYLESHEDPASLNDWITPLVLFLIIQRGDFGTLLRFQSSEEDTPYTAAVKFCVLTENIALLQNMPDNQRPEMMEFVDGRGDSPFHILFKMCHGPQGKLLATIVRLLLQKGVSPSVRDRSQLLPIDYVDPSNNKEVHDILRKYTQPAEAEMQGQNQQQEKQMQTKMNHEKGERRQLEMEEVERKRQIQNQRKAEEARKKEPAKDVTLDFSCKYYCEPRIDEAKALLKENNMRYAYLRLAEVLKKDHKSEKHKRMEEMVLDIVITFLGGSFNPEIPDKLVKIPHKLYEQIINGLAANEKWRQMYFTVKEHRFHYGDLSLPNFAKSMSLAKVIDHSSFQESEQLLVDVVDCMLNGGAVLDKDGKLAILAAIQACKFKVLEILLKWGANPVHLTIDQGDTPIHAALSIALERDKGNFSILNYLFDLYEKDPEMYPMLDPAQTNSDGDGLFHLVAKAKYSATTQKATELLFDKKVNASIINIEDKLPKDYLNPTQDRRLQFFWLASLGGEVKPKRKQKAITQRINDPKTQTEDIAEDEQDLLLYERQEDISSMSEESQDKIYKTLVPRQKKALKRHIEELIYNLPDIPDSIFKQKVVRMDESPNFRQRKEATIEMDKSEAVGQVEEVDVQTVEKPREIGEEQEVENEDLEIDLQVFDNLEWEVECTADVWKTLRDKKVLPELKQRIIRKIQLLAKGEWTTHLCKELRNVPPTLKLYEVKLSKASRIIWELAIAFSPRLSEDAELRPQYAEDEAEQPVCGGRIYSEVIRVWDIVFDHGKIFKSVQRIIKSHFRGEECIIQKKLKGVKQDQFKAGNVKRFPMVFAESDFDVDVNALIEYQESLQRYYPYESSIETDILKFYNFDSNLISHILHNRDMNIDFPFKVTDLEHAIINLKTNAPILLLGRSGTGKTTCCLYRLFSQFVSYWTGAVAADSKLLPRCQMFQQDDKIVDDEETNLEEDQSAGKTSPKEEAENKEEEGQLYDHLHQIFITKNVVLCSEVHKNFKELSHTCDVARHFVSQEEQPLPHMIQDLGDNQFPIFITFKKLLLMLDASLKGPCFFNRREGGSLKVEIRGRAMSDEAFSTLPALDEGSDDEYDGKNQYQNPDDKEDDGNNQDVQNRPRKKVNPRREVTYEVFAEEVWPRISKKWSIQYHPSLIWMEIMSFIRGSVEALSKPSGYLSKEEYLDLGRRRAPNFSCDKKNVYDIFKKYDHYKRQNDLFDELDLVQNVFNRLTKDKEMKWIIHQIYVDETQDFTQAELCLLLRVCHSPNEMFLTGDIVQNINGGIAFRFEDCRSLLYYAKTSMHSIGKFSSVKVPKKFYQLTHNYRSQAGILSLASSIEDLTLEFFPESFDRLKNDQGLLHGPLPVLLESCSLSDLAVLLRGNKKKTSHIEFGANQAILVVNDAARDNIPTELNHGLILTIYEAKGLEFDDILLYNFFKDSQVSKEWRVVTDFLEKLAAINQSKLHSSDKLVSINADILKLGNRPRPLAFDPNQQKVLNSELKHLYTAVTRARVNLWIFDEDRKKRAPMFEYFKARKLTRNITRAEAENDSIGGMFAKESSTKQWLQRGGEFMKHSLYEVAAKCFNRGKNFHMENIAKAHQSALFASRMKDTPAKMKEAFLMAAEQFLKREQLEKAVICLQNSEERELVAHLYEKMNQLEKAGKIYRKLKRPVEASRCYEKLGKFNLAVETLVENDQYELAVDTLTRYKSLRKELDQQLTPQPRILIENAPSREHTVESLSYKAAEAYHSFKNKEKMMATLERLPNLRERTDFLIRKNYIEEAAKMFQEAGMLADAVDLYTKKGMNKEALQCAQISQDKNAIAQSLILDNKIRLSQYRDYRDIEEEVKSQICENLNQAFYSLQDLENKLAAGEAALLTGELTGRAEFINKAFGAFSKSRPRSEIGQLECIHWMVHNSNLYEGENLRKCVIGMQNIFVNLFVLAKQNMENEWSRLQEIFKFFGFYPAEEENKLVYYPKQQPRKLLVMPKKNGEVFRCEEDKDKIRENIFTFLEERGIVWKRILEDVITNCRNKVKQCSAFRLGEPCNNSTGDDSDKQSCPFLHDPLKPKNFDLLTEYDMLAIELEVHFNHGAEYVKAVESDFDKESRFISKEFDERYKACNWLLEDLIPQNYHNAVISSDPERSRDLMKKLRYSRLSNMYVKRRMVQYLGSIYDEMETRERKDNVKVFVTSCFVIHLLNLEMKPTLDDVMSRFEDLMNKECCRKERRQKTEWAMKLGLMIDEFGEITSVRSIARRFCEGYYQITGMNNNPSEALIQFTGFCSLLSNTGSVEVLPHNNQLLLWMEYYTTVAFCLTAKVQNTPNFFFVIPESYIAVINFIDATFVQERGVPTFEAIQRHKLRKTIKCVKLLQESLERLIEIVCGLTSNTKINLLSHIFHCNNPETPIASEFYGIAERLLVLALVLLCNLGKSVYPVAETKLMSELCKIKVRREYPSRLSEALKSVQQARSPADVARALQILLSKRENDLLGYCIWDNFDKMNGLRKRELKAMELSKNFFLAEETLQAMNNPHGIGSRKRRTEIDEDDDMETPITMEEKMMIDRIRKAKERSDEENKASKKITQFMRRFIFCSKAHNLIELVKNEISKEKSKEKMKLFESIQITNTECGICGVQFKERTTGILIPVYRQIFNDSRPSCSLQPPSPLQRPQPSYEMVQQIQTTRSPDKVMDNPSAIVFENPPMFISQKSLEDSNQETREKHEKSEKHKEMVSNFQHFRLKYMQKIFDPLCEVGGFMQRYKLGSAELVEKDFKEETYNIVTLRRQRESVDNKIENIIKGCEWQNGEIWGEVQELIGSFHLIKDYVETEARKRKKRLEKQRETDLAKNKQDIQDDDLEAIEPVVDEPKERRPKRRRKRKGQRR